MAPNWRRFGRGGGGMNDGGSGGPPNWVPHGFMTGSATQLADAASLTPVRQAKNIQRIPIARMMDLRRDDARHVARTAAAQAGGNG